MPTSHFVKLSAIVELIVLADPRKFLDIGVGFGKYGVLAREYLELWDQNAEYGIWKRRVDGIEVFEKYITPLHRFVYDNIYIGNATDVVERLDDTYDLTIMIDILEHVGHDEGSNLLDACLIKSRNLLLCTPKDIGQQGEVFGNPHEAHRSQWEKSHFIHYTNHFFVPDPHSIICFIGQDAGRVWSMRVKSRLLGSE